MRNLIELVRSTQKSTQQKQPLLIGSHGQVRTKWAVIKCEIYAPITHQKAFLKVRKITPANSWIKNIFYRLFIDYI